MPNSLNAKESIVILPNFESVYSHATHKTVLLCCEVSNAGLFMCFYAKWTTLSIKAFILSLGLGKKKVP